MQRRLIVATAALSVTAALFGGTPAGAGIFPAMPITATPWPPADPVTVSGSECLLEGGEPGEVLIYLTLGGDGGDPIFDETAEADGTWSFVQPLQDLLDGDYAFSGTCSDGFDIIGSYGPLCFTVVEGVISDNSGDPGCVAPQQATTTTTATPTTTAQPTTTAAPGATAQPRFTG